MAILRRWPHLQQCSTGSIIGDDNDRPIENIGGNSNGNDAEASAERVLVGSDNSSSKELVKIEFEMNWKPGRDWVYRRATIQHLALFMPWEKFTIAALGDINEIWEY
ncbi:uncharacterized protein NECHADRAFT_89560 [Fusarium vanettenii 77-13-4]|uniref:Uncharacterized protein n=1 Tax=Fusarium vanettenii (strain ATCC MYA-4622 / CBS 123669 / FGSC 9596 / NRRL 45880 / 77-13-4) TaxID=660122 RepID=C7ZRK5_FUSV7|nr:uncharacterized protein NECHADRAFT_89560 [Fusarium vanettenii 77-13-4]EEU33358.1 predicted protein [Fusarium vanettenii 77-13-4]